MSAAFTPGPWTLHHAAKTAVVGSKGFVVASCGGYSSNVADPAELSAELHANARLVTASPDLLDAAKKFLAAQALLPQLSGPAAVEMIEAAQAARRAITKALGTAS